MGSGGTTEVNVGAATTQRRIEASREENQRQQGNLGPPVDVNGQPNKIHPATNRQVEHIELRSM